MDDVTRHPDDSTLFDLVDGGLDDARAEAVRTHLSRCAACAAFVQAARAGAPASSTAVEPMPVEAAARLQAAVTAAWRDRVAGIAATEAAEDAQVAATTDDGVAAGEFAGFAPIEPPAPEAPTTEADEPGAARAAAGGVRRPRWARRAVPVLAFVVLGALAGTSLYLGDETADRNASVEIAQDDGGDGAGAATATDDGSSSDTESEAVPDAPEAFTEGDTTSGDAAAGGAEAPDASVPGSATDASTGAATDATGGAATDATGGVPAGAPVDGTVDRNAAAGTAEGVAPPTGDPAIDGGPVTPPTADYEDFVEQERTCIATRDDTQLSLPNGQIPTLIVRGPFGIFLVCA